MTAYEKRKNLTEQMYSSAINVMLISFVNMSVIVLLVNINI